jgi:RNA polymerase sigma-70 factor, ECF subfamily
VALEPRRTHTDGVANTDLEAERAERELVAALRRGDRDGFEKLESRLRPELLRFLTTLLGDASEAEDIVQVTLLQIWRQTDAYDEQRGTLWTWAKTIARSRALDRLRKRIPEPRDPDSLVLGADRVTADPLDAEAERWRLAELLGRLPRREAALLRMRFYAQLSQREIATATGIPLGTVKSQMVSALRRLRRMLDEEGL